MSRWEFKPWKSVLEIKNGRNQKQVVNSEGLYPIYGSAGIMGYADDYICHEGTTVIGRKGSINRPIYVQTKFWNVDTAFGLSPLECLDSKFLYYFCLSHDFSKHDKGTTLPSLVKTDLLNNIFIPTPPIAEQKRIVALLDEAFEGIDSAIANTEKNLANARELFESYLNAIFTRKGDNWIEKPIDEISEVVSGYSFKSKDFSSSNSLKSIKITNVGVKEFIVDSGNYLPEGLVNSHRKFAVPAGSIVIALTRTIISSGLKVAVVPDEYHLALLNQRVAAIKADQKLMSQQFLFSYLCTSQVIEYVQSKVNTLMQPNLSINDLKKLLVPVPSLEEQSQIISGIEDLHKNIQCLEAIYQRKLATLNDLKQSILQKAFSGELTADVGDPVTQAVQETVAA